MKEILINIGMLNWGLGLIFMFISNASGIIKKTKYERIGWRKYKRGYSINEIKKVIKTVDETKEVIDKLKRKIRFRRIALLLLISTPILIIIGNL